MAQPKSVDFAWFYAARHDDLNSLKKMLRKGKIKYPGIQANTEYKEIGVVRVCIVSRCAACWQQQLRGMCCEAMRADLVGVF